MTARIFRRDRIDQKGAVSIELEFSRSPGNTMRDGSSIFTSAGVIAQPEQNGLKRKGRNHFAAIPEKQRHAQIVRDFFRQIDETQASRSDACPR